jgi:hypothetical protein
MGNSAWGHGYHRGFSDGARQGGLVGSLVTLGVGVVVTGGVWAVRKLRDQSEAKVAQLDGAEADEPETPRDDSLRDSGTPDVE